MQDDLYEYWARLIFGINFQTMKERNNEWGDLDKYRNFSCASCKNRGYFTGMRKKDKSYDLYTYPCQCRKMERSA